MRKTFFCGVDLHSNNAMYVVTDQQDKLLLKKRLPNRLPVVLESLKPFHKQLKVVAVESTYNWYWLVDGLMDHEYPVVLANPGHRSVRRDQGGQRSDGRRLPGPSGETRYPAHRLHLSTGGSAGARPATAKDPHRKAANGHHSEPAEHGHASDR